MAGPTTLFQTGNHAARPAASAGCVLYWCTDHEIVYLSDGTSWTNFQNLSTFSGSGIAETLLDAKGDIIAASAADTASRLAVGANGLALVAASGETTGLKWGVPNFIGAKVYNAGTQSISDDTVTAVTFGAEEFDTSSFHDTGSNTSRMTIPSGLDGKYLCIGGTRFAANATGSRGIFIGVNGTRVRGTGGTDNPSTTPFDGEVVTIVNVVATNYIELMVYQNSGGALDIGHASAEVAESWFAVHYLGA